MKCDNCSNDAAYTHAEPGVSPANYCTNCLPAWLHERANAGHFPLLTPIAEEVAEKPKKKAAAKEEPAVEDTPAE